jgi:hypothetical protein
VGDDAAVDLGVAPPGRVEVVDPGDSGEPRRGWADRFLGPSADDAEGAAPGPVGIVAPSLTDEDVELFLDGCAGVLAVMLPDEDVPDLWQLEPAEREQMTRYIMRVAAKRPRVAEMIERADGLMFAVVVSTYVARNAGERGAARAERRERFLGENQREAGDGSGRADAPAVGDVHGSGRVG